MGNSVPLKLAFWSDVQRGVKGGPVGQHSPNRISPKSSGCLVACS